MSNVRRWYVYLVSAISLQAVAWAVILLLRNLVVSGLDLPADMTALQIAVIVIGLPFYLVHWLWGQRLATVDVEERGDTLRRLYLYGTMAGSIGTAAGQTFFLLRALFGVVPSIFRTNRGEAALYHLLAILVMGALWFYHQRVARHDARVVPDQGGSATVRRLYVFGLCAAGLTMTTMATIYLLRWVTAQIGAQAVGSLGVSWTAEIARLVVGLPLWLVFWLWAQRLFEGPSAAERESVLRKLYLYGAIAVGAMGTVANATRILAEYFGRFLGLTSVSDVDLRAPLSNVLGLGLLWAYHALAIRDDARRAGEGPRQAGVRRLYAYLIAGTGLTALLIGLGGEINVIIRSLEQPWGRSLRVQLAWFSAAIVAGLPVWIVPWRQLQGQAARSGAEGAAARGSLARRIYVYLFLFVATMTVLSGMIYVVAQTLGWALGDSVPSLGDLGLAIAFSLIAVGVWLYHGYILRADRRLSAEDRIRELASARVVVLDTGDGHLAAAVEGALQRAVPGLDPEVIVPGRGQDGDAGERAVQLAQAELIVGPWTIAALSDQEGNFPPETVRAVIDSPAQKLLLPVRVEGWEWAGVDRWDTQDLARQAALAIRQTIAGDEVRPVRPLGASTIVLIVLGALIVLPVLVGLVASFFL